MGAYSCRRLGPWPSQPASTPGRLQPNMLRLLRHGTHAADESVSQLLIEAAETERLQGGLAASGRAAASVGESWSRTTAKRRAAPSLVTCEKRDSM